MKNIQNPKTLSSLKRWLLIILLVPVFSVFLFSSITVNAQVLVSMNPNLGQQGQTLTTVVTGSGTQFQSSSPNGNVLEIQLLKLGYDTIFPDTSTINIIDNTHFDVEISIPPAAQKGLYDLYVKLGTGENLTLPAEFRVGTIEGTVSGTVYYDTNGNGVKDTGEPPLVNERFYVTPDSNYVYSDALGNYSFGTYNGTRTIEWRPTNAHYYLLSSANPSYTVLINNNNSSGNDFGLITAITSITPNQANAGVTLTTTLTGDDIFYQTSSPPGNLLNFNLPGVFNFTIPPDGYVVLDQDTATVTFTVHGNAVPGIYDVAITVVSNIFPFDDITYIRPDAFTIGPPDGYVDGTIYFDADTNGVMGPGEFGVQYTDLFMTPDSVTISPDASGNFHFGVINGSHTVEIGDLGEFILSSADTAYTVTINNNTASGLDFGIKSHLYSISPNLAYQGQSLTTTITGFETQFQSSSPQGNIHEMMLIKSGGGSTIQGPLANITQPVDSIHFDALITVPGNAAIGYYDVSVTVKQQGAPWILHTYILPYGFHVGSGDVWPGDANYDLTANNNDVLNIGLAYGETGPVRAGASLSWVAQPGTAWSGFFQNGVNKKHADCDGNGVVDNDDTLAISLNYGLTHPARLAGPNQNQSSAPLLYLVANPQAVSEGDTVEVDIFLGNSTIPVDSIYGIAFTINFDTALVDNSYMPFDFSGCWMGTSGVDMLTYTKKIFTQGKADIALTRTNHLNQGGYGFVGKTGVVVVDNIGARLGNSVNLPFSISNVTAVTANEYYLTISTNGDNVSVDSLGDDLDEMISVYPNPVKDVLTINSGSAKITSLDIYNTIGQRIMSKEISSSKINIITRNFKEGIYLLKLVTDAGVMNRKFSVVEK
ncbi:MAG TPA: T9SS type A sorting domain-containing protein [Bacteroidia bacterium]|nr:T9SS type A sorting domain-containing protein [Bacteroidia bacterium]